MKKFWVLRKADINTLEGAKDVVSSHWLETSSRMARLNSGQVFLLRCTLVQQNISSWLQPVCGLTCPNKCSSQSHVLFSLQQQITFIIVINFPFSFVADKTQPTDLFGYWLLNDDLMYFGNYGNFVTNPYSLTGKFTYQTLSPVASLTGKYAVKFVGSQLMVNVCYSTVTYKVWNNGGSSFLNHGPKRDSIHRRF